MSPATDHSAALYQALTQAHGPDFGIDDFPPDPGAPAVQPPHRLTDPDELMVPLDVTLRLSWQVTQQLQTRAAEAGMSVDELVSEWVAAEASTEDSVPRDAILHMLAQPQRRSA